MKGFLMIGASQQRLSLQAMQPLHEARDRIAGALRRLVNDGECSGGVLLATCNRFEVLLDLGGLPADRARACLFADLDVPLVEQADDDAVAHLLRVATGLESLVLGEDQIIGQVSQAFREAKGDGLLSKHLHMVWSRVMHAARRIRGQRPNVSAPRSVAELSARIARESGPRIAIVGAGTTAKTAAENLRDLGVSELRFYNRTVSNARRLAQHFDGAAGSIDELLTNPPDVDAVIVAIAGRTLRLPIASMPSLQCVVDISQPSVAVGLDEQRDVHFLDLDGLSRVEQRREKQLEQWRDDAVAQARNEAGRIWSEVQNGRVDLGQLLGLHVESASAEVDRALRGRLRNLDEDLQEEVRKLAERVARRNAHLHLSDVKHFVHT